MQSTSINRGYSDFFASGFKAVTSRLHNSRSPSAPAIFPQIDITSSALRPSGHHTTITKKAKHKPRPASMFVSSQLPESRESSRRRRSSIVNLSSRLYNRIVASSTTEEPSSRLTIKNWSKRNSSAEDALSELPDLWITPGDSFTPTCQNGRSVFESLFSARF